MALAYAFSDKIVDKAAPVAVKKSTIQGSSVRPSGLASAEQSDTEGDID